MRSLRGLTRAAVLAVWLGAPLGWAQGGTEGYSGWERFGGDAAATRFSQLDQVNASNVEGLRLAWALDLGFTGRVQGAPAAWRDLLYVSTDRGLLALDAVTGAERWRYEEPYTGRSASGLPLRVPRGSPLVTHARAGGATVYAALPNAAAVVALDALTGALRWRSDVGSPDYALALRTNPTLAGDVIVVGPTGADLSPAPGQLVALDPADGSVAWTFDLVPLSDADPAWPTWTPIGPGWGPGVGGGAAWNAGAYDAATGVVIFGTGQPLPTDRLDPRRADAPGAPSADLYTSSFVALDAATGALRWYHQVVPADEWGFDQHTVPIVADQAGRRVALLATTTGFVLSVDVVTGELLSSQQLVEDGNVHLGYDAAGRALIADDQRRSDPDELLRVCPGTRWANIAPGAYSPASGLLYRPNDLACVRQGTPPLPSEWQPGTRPTWLMSEVRFPEDYFARWGELTAIDPQTGAVAWRFPLPYPHDAGALATAGGLVFSAFADRQFRAFEAATGEVLWSHLLSAHSDATPITYLVAGEQYVAVMAGREAPVTSLPDAALPPSVTGPATLYVFKLGSDH